MKEPLSPQALKRYLKARKSYYRERFQAGYATGLQMIESGSVPIETVEKLGPYLSECGFEYEDHTPEKLHDVITRNGDVEQRQKIAWCERVVGKPFPEPSMIAGIYQAIAESWAQIERADNSIPTDRPDLR